MSTLPEPTTPVVPRFIIVSPTYNHGRNLADALGGLAVLALPIVVINDGSTDDTGETLEKWQADVGLPRHVITHPTNRGKAAALHTGFSMARELGYSHVLTIDSDGQHAPADLRSIIDRAKQLPGALIVGARPRGVRGCPLASTIGRLLSNHFVWVASGVRVRDSQSGMRCYPLERLAGLDAKAERFAFETEVLIRSGWAGMPVIEVPITGNYEISGGRVTHFRIGLDTFDAICMHARLIARSVFPGDPVPRVAMGVTLADDNESATGGVRADPMRSLTGTIFHRACWWLGPKRVWLMVQGDSQARERLAASVATGLFMATVPVYGVKTVACLWLAAKFRLHPTVVLALSSLSTPPLGFVFAFCSIIVGYLLLHGSIPTLELIPTWSNFTLTQVGAWLGEWLLGSIIVGVLIAAFSYGLMRLLLGLGTSAREAVKQ